MSVPVLEPEALVCPADLPGPRAVPLAGVLGDMERDIDLIGTAGSDMHDHGFACHG